MKNSNCYFENFGITGVRVFERYGITKFLVNSAAAREIVLRDLSARTASVSGLFHPAFAPEIEKPTVTISRQHAEEIIVGTFGIPNKEKQTEIIVSACQLLTQTGRRVRLIVAGYRADKYVRRFQSSTENLVIEGFGDLTDAELFCAMSTVDVAVQLRRRNLGESSGVIPQLLVLGKNVIVSDVGSFAEYGAAVQSVLVDCSVEKLAATIVDGLHDHSRKTSMETYVTEHSTKNFRASLVRAVDEIDQVKEVCQKKAEALSTRC
ncbi:MAG: hypothetical protein DDT39_01704 [Firmicutes bacterium]|nr:hypothetical protein [candidate division NPL-UPA2 bacterium]